MNPKYLAWAVTAIGFYTGGCDIAVAGEFNVGVDGVFGYAQTFNEPNLAATGSNGSTNNTVPWRLRLGTQFGTTGTHGAEYSYNTLVYDDYWTNSSGARFKIGTETLTIHSLRYIVKYPLSHSFKINGRAGLVYYDNYLSYDTGDNVYGGRASGSSTGSGLTFGLEVEYRILPRLSVVGGVDYLSSFQTRIKFSSAWKYPGDQNFSKWEPSIAFIGVRGNF